MTDGHVPTDMLMADLLTKPCNECELMQICHAIHLSSVVLALGPELREFARARGITDRLRQRLVGSIWCSVCADGNWQLYCGSMDSATGADTTSWILSNRQTDQQGN